ncbi:hypothetical protein LEN26_019291 [Aphanomyces euteiches]|nr:hypothetical protein LEN26_019291 [Aphanomyces euteiches]KAH9111023.1 hypothetical protein AeMF1_014384 [Aphanomyces euteiches]KAH9197553.1 hypothetical protein AeNC1_000503 [Aphanomyces euteiches]
MKRSLGLSRNMTARLRRQKFAQDDQDDVSLYDIEFGNGPLGIQFETDFYGNHATVKTVVEGGQASKLVKADRCIVQEGHIVVAVNGHDVSQDPFKTVMDAIKKATTPRIIRFLDPTVLPLDQLNQHATEQLLNRDHYGFAKDDSYILKYRKQIRLKKAQHNAYSVEKEWVDFIHAHGGMAGFHEAYKSNKAEVLSQLEPLLVRGIPSAFRAPVWNILADVDTYKQCYPSTYYQGQPYTLTTMFMLDAFLLVDLLRGDLSPSTLEDIEKDVGRTYPEHTYFQEAKGRQELANVLRAYSMHNPTIGYCQSMNFLVGILLLFLVEEESFWLLCVMMEKYLPTENYTHSMVGCQVDQVVFKRLVALQLPQLSRVFDEGGIEIELVTLQWFLCVFVCTLPLDTALRVWDYLFLHGQEVLFAVALSILKVAEDKLVAAGAMSHSELFVVVRELGFDLHEADEFMEVLVGFFRSDETSARSEDKTKPLDVLVQKFNEFSTKLRKGSIPNDLHSNRKRFTYALIQQWRDEIRPQIRIKDQ